MINGDLQQPARRPQQTTPDVREPAVLGRIDISAEVEQVKTARRWLRGLLGEDHPAAFWVELLGCELVTNAVLHSDSARPDEDGRPGTVSIAAWSIGKGIRVEVTDAGSTCRAPVPVDAGVHATSGRGLAMLHDLTDGRCGTWSDAKGRTVWFLLDTDSTALADGDGS
ncbi:ATP-binding protein [Actinomadura rugatobispora]|uniref:ATP-binding protein n=1 Tax=Actinomadura rugatobispora TaxID=1994 RepID=A0ABW1A5S3_9ACTN|nr:ATP-binding protein [Actinomadura rugatobispora]